MLRKGNAFRRAADPPFTAVNAETAGGKPQAFEKSFHWSKLAR
jgi:hypothetical protein